MAQEPLLVNLFLHPPSLPRVRAVKDRSRIRKGGVKVVTPPYQHQANGVMVLNP